MKRFKVPAKLEISHCFKTDAINDCPNSTRDLATTYTPSHPPTLLRLRALFSSLISRNEYKFSLLLTTNAILRGCNHRRNRTNEAVGCLHPSLAWCITHRKRLKSEDEEDLLTQGANTTIKGRTNKRKIVKLYSFIQSYVVKAHFVISIWLWYQSEKEEKE